MTYDVASEVEDETVLFVLAEPETPADHLVIEPGREGGAEHRHAVDVRGVEAVGEHTDVDEVLDLACLEVGKRPVAEPR